MKKKRFWVFISHASQDCNLAKELKSLISLAVPSLKNRVFVSSDGNSIPQYVKWEMSITDAHKESSVVVALMTPNSVFRPWVMYEAGGANFHRKKPLFVVRANGLSVDSLPGPLKQWQSTDLSKDEDLKTLCQSVASALRLRSRWDRGTLQLANAVAISANKYAGDWGVVNTSLTAEVVHGSPFNLENLLDQESQFSAKNVICVVGQSLHSLVEMPQIKSRIFKWLENRVYTQRRFALITCDPRESKIVRAWQRLHHNKDFIPHLLEAVRTFKSWQREARRKCRKGKLLFAPIKVFPLNVTFVDPEEESGFLVLTAVSISGATGNRPHFVVGKHQQPQAFNYFWSPILQHIQTHPLWKP
jgi:hypothetical protein